jgi:hypothetical protein
MAGTQGLKSKNLADAMIEGRRRKTMRFSAAGA